MKKIFISLFVLAIVVVGGILVYHYGANHSTTSTQTTTLTPTPDK